MATKIETLKKPNGDQVLPRTRAKAVSMENGTTVESAIAEVTTELSGLSVDVAYINTTDNENVENPEIEMGDIIIDSALSASSTNPVQNRVVTERFNQLSEVDTVLSERMNTFTALGEGSTTGDAELHDIRVGYDGVVYETAGEAVREQTGNIKHNLDDLKLNVVGSKKEILTKTIETDGEQYREARFDSVIPVNAVITSKTEDFFYYFLKENGVLVSSYDVVTPYTVTEAFRGVSTLDPHTISITYEFGEDIDGELDRKQDKLIAGDGVNIASDGKTISVNNDQLRFDLFGTKKEVITEKLDTEGTYKEASFNTIIPVGAVITKKVCASNFYFIKENGSLISESEVKPPYTVTEAFRGVSTLDPHTISIIYEIGENVDGEFDRTRRIIKVNRDDDDITVFEKMLFAYSRGYMDVIFEPSTYILSDVYNYIENYTEMAKGLPVGNNCRYFFNGSTVISNAPSNGYSQSRNILDCQNMANNYEIYDCTLINNGGRYCIHDEGAGDVIPYNHLYKNVKMIYNHTDLTPDNGCKAFGSGVGHITNITFENCQFIHNGQDTVPIAIHNVPTRKEAVVFNLSMVNCYINQYTIALANFDKTQDELNFYLFGNLWAMDFTDSTPNLIKNNNNVII